MAVAHFSNLTHGFYGDIRTRILHIKVSLVLYFDSTLVTKRRTRSDIHCDVISIFIKFDSLLPRETSMPLNIVSF